MTESYPFPIDENVLSVQFACPEKRDSRAAYWRGVGLLISNFAKVETALKMLTAKMIRTDLSTGKIITSGMTCSAILNLLRQLNNLPNNADTHEINIIITQIEIIIKERHNIAHNGLTFIDPVSAISHKNLIAKPSTKIISTSYSIDDLHAMIDDCAYITIRLIALMEPTFLEKSTSTSCKITDFKQSIYGPWRYQKQIKQNNAH